MSWYVTGGAEDIAILRAKALEQNPECADQFDAAEQAVRAIIDSGACGPDYDASRYYVTLSGHSNPDHAPREGYANDCVAVTVSQK